ncbi:hypothetical protein Trydic_g3568 [Trypoxylus dichotomus]
MRFRPTEIADSDSSSRKNDAWSLHQLRNHTKQSRFVGAMADGLKSGSLRSGGQAGYKVSLCVTNKWLKEFVVSNPRSDCSVLKDSLGKIG